MSLQDLEVINQTGDQPLRKSNVKLKLFDGSIMQPCGAAILKLHRNGTVDQLEFQIVDGKNKPLLSAETCERLGLLKINIPDAIEVNSIAVEQVKTEAPLTKERVSVNIKMFFRALDTLGTPVVLLSVLTTPQYSTPQDEYLWDLERK